MAHEFEVARGPRVAHYVFSKQGIHRAARYRRRSVRWERIRTLWTLSKSILVFYSDTGYMVLPLDQVPDDARDYLMEQARNFAIRVKSLG